MCISKRYIANARDNRCTVAIINERARRGKGSNYSVDNEIILKFDERHRRSLCRAINEMLLVSMHLTVIQICRIIRWI